MRTFRFISLGILLFCSLSLWAQDTTLQYPGKGTSENLKGSPVILSGDTIYEIYSSLGAFSPSDRAKAISARLKEIIEEHEFYPDSLKASEIEQEYYIIYRDRVLLVISKKDTIGTGMSLEALAVQVADTLKEHLADKSKSINFWFLIKNIVYTVVVVLLLVLIIILIRWLFRKIFRYVEKNKKKLFKSIVLNNYEFLNAEREYRVALVILKIIRIALIVFFFLIALPVVFSIFPATEGITRKIIGMIWSPVRAMLLGVVNYLPSLITIIVIYFVFKYLVRFVRFLSNEVEGGAFVLPGFHPDWAKPTYNIIRVFLYAFMFVVIFPYLPGSDSPIFRGVSVFLGVLLSLGSSTLISNAMAGMVITYMRPYKIGDRIKVDDVVGDVVEKTLMITRIKTIKNEDVTIPNAKILTGYTVNYTTPTDKEGLILHTTITIGYDAPWRTVHELLIRAADLTEGVSNSPRPFVLQTSLDDFYISYQINAFVKNAHIQAKIKSDLHQNIQDEFNRAGIEIMSPHYRSERDGNPVAIPDELEIELPPKKERAEKTPTALPKQKGKTGTTK